MKYTEKTLCSDCDWKGESKAEENQTYQGVKCESCGCETNLKTPRYANS